MTDKDDGLTPIEVIRSIREQWGVDGGPGASTVVAFLHEALQRALTTLSSDIYKSETHFLLELIQNAGTCARLSQACCVRTRTRTRTHRLAHAISC